MNYTYHWTGNENSEIFICRLNKYIIMNMKYWGTIKKKNILVKREFKLITYQMSISPYNSCLLKWANNNNNDNNNNNSNRF